MILSEWARRWDIKPTAIMELISLIGVNHIPSIAGEMYGDGTETANQQKLRLEAPRIGARLWRNNVGAAFDVKGRPVRFGLANDSPAVNARIKSSDLIGVTPHVITPEDVGKTAGIFTSIEVKKTGWTYSGKGREPAQKTWLELIISLGGIAKFSTGEL